MLNKTKEFKQHWKKIVSVMKKRATSLQIQKQKVKQLNISNSKMLALEPRIMFDAAALSTAVETIVEEAP